MRTYKYWAKWSTSVDTPSGKWLLSHFGSSNESAEDAARDARLKVERVKELVLGGGRADSYEYSDRPLREEVKREIYQHDELAAVITRNSYGSLVLNTARVMFIDIDTAPEDGVGVGPGFLGRLIGKRPTAQSKAAGSYIHIDEFRRKAEAHGVGMRVYRTPNGYRCLVTDRLFDPVSEEAFALLRAFGSDELYVRLCRVQECFRARLTPKPWRIDMVAPRSHYPWAERELELEHREWERDYERRIQAYSACSFLGHCGNEAVMDDIAEIVKIHDALACTGKPLA